MPLTLILYSCGFQLVTDPAIVNNPALLRIRIPSRRDSPALLDLSLIHGSVRDPLLKQSGRPDIVHSSLLSVTGSPFWKRNPDTRFFVHTVENKVWKVDSDWKPPVSYFRFYWLMEKFLDEGSLVFRNRRMEFKEQEVQKNMPNLKKKLSLLY